MVNHIEESKAEVNINYLNLRKFLGLLGISLPFILVIVNEFKIESSISHFYYTDSSVLFTGILISFGLFLLSYKGYEKEQDEIISDNLITNCAGFFIIITALIPTACSDCALDFINSIPNGHNNLVASSFHLISAGIFIALMGVMSFFQFTKSKNKTPIKITRNKIYKICGIVIWLCLLLLILRMILSISVTASDIFYLESIALIFFGIAWMIKGETLQKMGF